MSNVSATSSPVREPWRTRTLGGAVVGRAVGRSVGAMVGRGVGAAVVRGVGRTVGRAVGPVVGVSAGVGRRLGVGVVVAPGVAAGVPHGVGVGPFVGSVVASGGAVAVGARDAQPVLGCTDGDAAGVEPEGVEPHDAPSVAAITAATTSRLSAVARVPMLPPSRPR
jgi:hypothetical protein